jgi:hypothetical protein
VSAAAKQLSLGRPPIFRFSDHTFGHSRALPGPRAIFTFPTCGAPGKLWACAQAFSHLSSQLSIVGRTPYSPVSQLCVSPAWDRIVHLDDGDVISSTLTTHRDAVQLVEWSASHVGDSLNTSGRLGCPNQSAGHDLHCMSALCFLPAPRCGL